MQTALFRSIYLSALLAVAPTIAVADEGRLQTVIFDQLTFRALAVKPDQVSLHWLQADGKPYRYFFALKNALLNSGKTVVALMNAGIYSDNDQPAGLHIENGRLLHALNTQTGYGNFHLEPNGVFLVDQHRRALVMTTAIYQKHYANKAPTLKLATQSGPMLVIDGKLNPILLPNSQSTYTRSGVCITRDGRLLLLDTDGAKSNFYQFARASQQFGCDSTLYLDGNISKLYVAGENNSFHWSPFVGILSVTQ